jgi:F-type H+-transporting ATPase subunit b
MHLDPWTLGLQAANFLILVWLLRRFLYQPVLAIIAERQAAVDKLNADAAAARTAAEALRDDLQREIAKTADERDAILMAARDAADEESKAALAKARAEADTVRSEAQKGLERERAEIVGSLGRQAARLAAAIVRRLLKEAPSARVQTGLLEMIGADVAALPADARAKIVERLTAHGESPQVVTATALGETAAADLSQSMGRALGVAVSPAFRVDPGLLCGVEIHFPFTILRRCWSEDLKRIESEMVDVDHAATLV